MCAPKLPRLGWTPLSQKIITMIGGGRGLFSGRGDINIWSKYRHKFRRIKYCRLFAFNILKFSRGAIIVEYWVGGGGVCPDLSDAKLLINHHPQLWILNSPLLFIMVIIYLSNHKFVIYYTSSIDQTHPVTFTYSYTSMASFILKMAQYLINTKLYLKCPPQKKIEWN